MKKYNLAKVFFSVFAFLLLLTVAFPSKTLALSYNVTLVPGCTTTTGTNSSGVSCSSKTMIKFTNKIDIKQERIDVQKVLNMVLVPSPNLTLDGIFGRNTVSVIKAFQAKYNLKVDGKVGNQTIAALEQVQIDYNNTTSTPTTTPQTCANGATNYPTCTITALSFSLPYLSAITASTYDTTNNKPPYMTVDNNITTENRWAGQGDGAWIKYTFTSNQQLNGINILFYKGNTRVTKVSLAYSLDDVVWTNIGNYSSSGKSTTYETFNFPSTITAKHFKIIGHGNNEIGSTTWTSIMEVNFNLSSTTTCSGSAIQTCAVTNGTGSQSRTCTNGTWSTYGACTATSCNTGYQISGNSCALVGVADTTKPVVSSFTIPSTGTTLAVSIMAFTATDNGVIAGYALTETSTTPVTWQTVKPTSYTFASAGTKTLYAWTKDTAGNVSLAKTATITITLPITTCSGSATQTCTITNGTGSQSRTCTNGTWSSYGTCAATSCNTGYVISGNACAVIPTTTVSGNEIIQTGTGISVMLPKTGISASELGVVVNDNDPLSVQIANYYISARGIPSSNVAHVNIPTSYTAYLDSGSSYVSSLKQQIDTAFSGKNIQALALTWMEPWWIDRMSSTSAISIPFKVIQDGNTCNDTNAKSGNTNPYVNNYNSVSPWTDLGFRPSMIVAATTFADAKALIDRGISSDKTFPTGTAYMLKTSDTQRSARCTGTGNECQTLIDSWDSVNSGIKTTLVNADSISNKNDVLFYFTGMQTVPNLSTNTYLPGAIGDSLTSCAGQLTDDSCGQMSAIEWLRNGATGSSGTVTEPCAIIEKFPNPAIVVPYYFKGNTLVEAYWKSVKWPAEGLFIGEPLAKPFGHKVSMSNNVLTITTSALTPGVSYVLESANSQSGPFTIVQSGISVPTYQKKVISVSSPTSSVYRLRSSNESGGATPVADTTKPVVSSFTIPSTGTTLAVSIMAFTATDNGVIAGYALTETSTTPVTWQTVKPTSYTFASAGTKTLYAWTKDTAGNVSLAKTATITITLPITTCSGSATQTCTITNGTGSQSRTCTNGTWSSYGTCAATSCNTGYVISGNACIVVTASNGNTYYISPTGNDSNTGTSTGAPWKTISKVNSTTTFKAGDKILFERGGTWREMLTVSASGSASSYITFGNYGSTSSPKPRILGSTQLTGWVNTGTNVWQSSTSVTNPRSVGNYGGEVIFENTDGTKSWGTYSSGTPSGAYKWSYSSNKISIYSTSDPSTKYKAVEAPQRQDIINLNNKNYINIDGIDIFYSGQTGICYAPDEPTPMPALKGLIIQNVEIAYISVKDSEQGYGIEALYSDMTIKNSKFHDCGRRPISLHLYGSTSVNNILIDNNQFYSGWHTTGPDIQVGSGYTGNITNVTVSNNTIYEPKDKPYYYTEGLYLSNKGGEAKMDNISIYNNTFMNHGGYGILLEAVQGAVKIYNNTFYGYASGGSKFPHISVQSLNGLASKSVTIKNNILASDSAGEGIEVYGSGQTSSAVTSSNNLIYNSSSAVSGATTADPKFVNASSGDLHLQSGSPAISKGVSVGLTTDKDGKAYGNPPSIGAYEYGSVLGATKHKFTQKLKFGSNGDEVMELQKVLAEAGYLKATPNGNFGPATEAALKEYQKENGLTADGKMGPVTMGVLNK